MKADLEIDGKKITINLTQDQINEITKQNCRLQKAEDIQDYRDACEVLGKAPKTRENFDEEWEWITHQLYTQIEAGNFLDNDRKKYVPDFTDGNISKYIPYWERKGSGWVLMLVTVTCSLTARLRYITRIVRQQDCMQKGLVPYTINI